MNDIMETLRKKYPKRGRNPGKDLDIWARNYMDDISHKIDEAEKLLKTDIPIDYICTRTGLRKETVESLQTQKNKKKKLV